MIFKKRTLWIGLTYLFAFLLAFSFTAASLLEHFRTTVDSVLNTQSQSVVSDDTDTLYSTFVPDEAYLDRSAATNVIVGANSEALLRAGIQLGRKQGYEGTVLLKNNGALPLQSEAGVTLLGKRSHVPLLGSGMGVDVKGQFISLETALGGTTTDFAKENTPGRSSSKYDYSKLTNFAFKDLNIDGRTDGAGANFRLNPEMINKYAQLTASGSYSCSYNDMAVKTGYNTKEPSSNDISGVSLTGYKDAAIIVFSRPNSEAIDFTRGGTSEGIEPFALSKNEKSIVSYATENFDKVIVIINANSQMEIGELKDNDKVDAILWIGHPGAYGLLGVADILCGRVSPSGGLYDAYPTYNLSAPATVNVGDYSFTNKADLTRTSNNGTYVIEAEGIYVGYKYYETRYNDVVLGKGNADSSSGVYASRNDSWNYLDEMAYTFGYGLSFTTFEQEIVGKPVTVVSGHSITTTISVKVTNTGAKEGSVPVQIYGQAPYEHGKTKVEKSAIQLLAFDKTETLQPGESQTLEIKVDWQDIASYDSTYDNGDGTFGSYILDNGNYYFALGYNNDANEQGAHAAVNNVLAAQGHTPTNTAGRMDDLGDANLVYTYQYTYAGQGETDGYTFGYSKTNTKIQNQIPYADWNYFKSETKVTYLSRGDWKGTYPVEYSSLAISDQMTDYFNGKYYEIKTDDDVSQVKWEENNGLQFFQLALSEYDDSRWTQLLNQLSLQESILLAAYSGDNVPTTNGIGLLQQKVCENSGNGVDNGPYSNAIDKSSPWYISEYDNNANMSGKSFGSAPLLASSFNPRLYYELGVYIGNEALFYGLPILWGPGLNTHRTPYNGRTGEYYSEDPVLSGITAMEFAVGARSKGLITTMKHFAFNDQETNRSGVAPFMTEQRAREIELRAYQIAVEATKYDGKGLIGMMTSFSKIGPVECTASYGLLTGIAIKEWGFHGQLVTDIYDDVDLFPAIVNSGCTGYDYRGAGTISFGSMANHNMTWRGEAITVEMFAKDVTLQNALKESNHNMLYALCQSNLMNLYNISTHIEWHLTWWRAAYISAIAVTAALTLASVALYVVATIQGRKQKEAA